MSPAKPKKTVELDLWAEDGRRDLPAISVTPVGLSLQGTQAEFDKLCLVLGGWAK